MAKEYTMHSDGAYYDADDKEPSQNLTQIENNVKNCKKADGKGKRLNTGKIPLSMVPTSAMYAIARVFEAGAKKYEKDNWRRGMDHSIPYECALRHLLKYYEGEDRDEETGELHLAHALTNIAMLIEYQTTCPHLDDRFEGIQATYRQFDSNKTIHKIEITEQDLENMAEEILKK